jgi:DNA-directed RNA polymerase subunit RPC12/RpoP
MALIKCSECGKEISDKAPACPSCGAPLAAKLNDEDLKVFKAAVLGAVV